MPDNKYPFDDLELAPGVIIHEGYAEMDGMNIVNIYVRHKGEMVELDGRFYNAGITALNSEHHQRKIEAQFGDDLNAGLARAA